MQILLDVMNMSIKVVASDQACALGAAMFVATAAGLYHKVHEAMKAMNAGYDKIYEPNAATAAIYERLYQDYVAYANLVEKETMSHVG